MTHGDREPATHGRGRSLAAPGRFARDDGAPDAAIRHALDHRDLIDALRSGRVIVAVVATVDEVEVVDGLQTDKSSDMSIVSMVTADGRRGLLAFTGLDALRAWNPQARPVPVTGIDAARAALEDGCEAVVLDVAGPRMQVVAEMDLLVLADIDPIDHARVLLERHLAGTFGDASCHVVVAGERLRVIVRTADVDAQRVSGSIPARIVALVPEGIEVQPA